MNYAEDRRDRRARHGKESISSIPSSRSRLSSTPAVIADLSSAQSLLRSASVAVFEESPEALNKLREAHELAGRSLRDCGLCRHAAFHYAQAFRCSPESWVGAGDYAQMADLAGFPEIGAIFLLYYRAGGAIDGLALQSEATFENCVTSVDILTNDPASSDCGCGDARCGKAICESVLPSTSDIYENIITSLQELDGESEKPCGVTAASILEVLSKVKKKKKNKVEGILKVNALLESVGSDINVVLRFWEDLPYDCERQFPPVLQALLLKLLFASPLGGPFLLLACRAIPHLAVRLPQSSYFQMGLDHKSHWAYYILIRAVVLGERVKKHRRGTAVPYHVPVWDVIHDIDCRIQEDSHDGDKHPSFQEQMKQIGISDLTYGVTLRPSCLPSARSRPPIFVLGDSHVLSIAWQKIEIPSLSNVQQSDVKRYRSLIPYPATGIKAWHTRMGTHFFTTYNLHASMKRLPDSCKTIMFSAGEIDCREGIGGERLEGYQKSCNDAVLNTVKEYLRAMNDISATYGKQILLLPVAPHAYRSVKNGKSAGRAQRRERMLLWNDLLRNECDAYGKERSVFLLDYEVKLRCPDETSPVGFALNKAYNADYTHMNSAFLPHLELALARCAELPGFRTDLL